VWPALVTERSFPGNHAEQTLLQRFR